jgi:hypothetical protein
MGFAQGTSVSEERSRAEIEQTIRKHVGRNAAFSYGTIPGRAFLNCRIIEMGGRCVIAYISTMPAIPRTGEDR